MPILVKEGFILTSGFVRASDGAIIPSRNVTIKSEVDTPVLLDEDEIARRFGQAAAEARVEKLTTNDIDNMSINYDDYIKANQLEVHTEGQIVDIEYTGQDVQYLNPAVVEQYLFTQGSYLLISSQVYIREFTDDLEKQLTLALEDKQNKDVALIQGNDKDINPLGDIIPGADIVEENKIPTRGEVKQAADILKQATDNNKSEADDTKDKVAVLEPKVAANEVGVEDYFNNKANFALVSDQDSTKRIDLTALAWTQNGNNVELDVSTIDFTGFLNAEKVEIKTINATEAVFIVDTFNDGMRTKNEIHINGNDQSIYLTVTDQLFLIEGLGAQQIAWFTGGTPQFVEQKGKTVSGSIDTVARAAAASAQSTANSANAKAEANIKAIAAINAKLLTFQTSSDAALKGAATIVAAINVNYDKAVANAGVIATLGSKKVSGGDLLSTAEVLATEKHVSDADAVVLAAAKADATSKDTALETKITAEQKVITDKKANTTDVFLKTDYEEKEITIPTITETTIRNYYGNSATNTNSNVNIGSDWKPKRLISLDWKTASGAHSQNYGGHIASDTSFRLGFADGNGATGTLNVSSQTLSFVREISNNNHSWHVAIEYEKVIPAQIFTALVKK